MQAKPVKLLKVTAYLEKKVEKEVPRESVAWNRITLEIIGSILAMEIKERTDDESHDRVWIVETIVPSILKIMRVYLAIDWKDRVGGVELWQRLLRLWEELSLTISTIGVVRGKVMMFLLPGEKEKERKVKKGASREEGFFDLLTVTYRMLMQSCPEENVDRINEALLRMDDFAEAPLGKDRLRLMLQSLYGGCLGSTLYTGIVSHCGRTGRGVAMLLENICQVLSSDGWTQQRIANEYFFGPMVDGLPASSLPIFLSGLFRQLELLHSENGTIVLSEALALLLRSHRGPLGYSAIELAGNLFKLLRRQRPTVESPPQRYALKEGKEEGGFQMPPARTVFAIGDAFRALLQHASFTLLRFEIVLFLLQKAFLRTEADVSSSIDLSTTLSHSSLMMNNTSSRHNQSIASVTLNSTEEDHFRNVLWGLLFSLLQDQSSRTIMSLLPPQGTKAQQRLSDTLAQIALSYPDPKCRLNALVFWHELLQPDRSLSLARSLIDSNEYQLKVRLTLVRLSEQLVFDQQQNLYLAAAAYAVLQSALKDKIGIQVLLWMACRFHEAAEEPETKYLLGTVLPSSVLLSFNECSHLLKEIPRMTPLEFLDSDQIPIYETMPELQKEKILSMLNIGCYDPKMDEQAFQAISTPRSRIPSSASARAGPLPPSMMRLAGTLSTRETRLRPLGSHISNDLVPQRQSSTLSVNNGGMLLRQPSIHSTSSISSATNTSRTTEVLEGQFDELSLRLRQQRK